MMLETGYNGFFDIRRREHGSYVCKSFGVLYLSDFHFNKRSGDFVSKIITKVNVLNPDIILLGGDYVDSKNGLKNFETLLSSFANRKNVFAVAGNHDYFFGIESIKKIITNNNVRWVEKSSYIFELEGTTIQVDGNMFSKKIKDVDFSILCMHKPLNIEQYTSQYNLAFAGHLHGCQFVLWEHDKALYPGRLFYKWNILEKEMDNCLYLISKGMGDTLPVRFNCSKEMIFVTVIPEKNHS